MFQKNKEELKRIMKEVDELIAHQQDGTPHRFKGEQFINHIKTLLSDIDEQISRPNQSETAMEYLVQTRDVVRDKLKIETLKVIIDPSEIAKERVAKEFPEGLEYDKFLAKRRVELGDKLGEALKSKEAENLRKLGLNSEEIILRGFMTEEEKAMAAQNFVENTKKNLSGYIIVILGVIGFIWLLVSIFS